MMAFPYIRMAAHQTPRPITPQIVAEPILAGTFTCSLQGEVEPCLVNPAENKEIHERLEEYQLHGTGGYRSLSYDPDLVAKWASYRDGLAAVVAAAAIKFT